MIARVRAMTRAFGVAAVTSVVVGAFELSRSVRLDSPDSIARWKARWVRGLRRVAGLRLTILGHAPPKPVGRGQLVVSNHRSALDILALFTAFPEGAFLSRGDLANWPVLGRGATVVGTLYVDREVEKSRTAAIRAIRRRLSEGGTVIVFPEGTTHGDDVVRPFQEGAFLAARGLDVDVVPVGVAYEPGAAFIEPTFGEHVGKLGRRPSTRAVVAIGAPFDLGKHGRKATEKVREHVTELVAVARREIDGARPTPRRPPRSPRIESQSFA